MFYINCRPILRCNPLIPVVHNASENYEMLWLITWIYCTITIFADHDFFPAIFFPLKEIQYKDGEGILSDSISAGISAFIN